MDYSSAKAITFKLSGVWLTDRERELGKLMGEVRKRYSQIKKIASRNIKNSLIRAVLKAVDRVLRFGVRRVENRVKRLQEEIRKIEEARTRLESGDPSLAIDLLAEAGVLASLPTMGESNGPPFANLFFMELIDGLRGERK